MESLEVGALRETLKDIVNLYCEALRGEDKKLIEHYDIQGKKIVNQIRVLMGRKKIAFTK